MKDVNLLYAKALSSIVLPAGAIIAGATATDRFSFGFQVFDNNGEDTILLTDGTSAPASSAPYYRREMFAAIADEIFADTERQQWDFVDEPESRECTLSDGPATLSPEGRVDFATLPTVAVPSDFTRWDCSDTYPKDVYPDMKVAVLYIDGTTDQSIASDFDWGIPVNGNFIIIAYKKVEEQSAEHAREDLDPTILNTSNQIHFGEITETLAEESGYTPVDSWLTPATLDAGRIAAFRFRDGHVVVAEDGAQFWADYVKGASTFRPLKENEEITSVRYYPSNLFFNSPVPEGRYKTHDVDVLDRVRIFFVVGSPVYKHAFEVDWSFVGDPRNDVVAYEILKGA